MSGVYYNEIDPFAAQLLRNLIKAGHIADGVVDTRSIIDVCASDLREFKQCHFFAGAGVWSYALRRAGWRDDDDIWSASCPCQPFSVAGMGAGFDDERHLWPFFFHLAEQRRPRTIVGEQVASKDADPWLDLVQTDLEAVGYAFGAVAFPSAGVGAPHIRDRTYWLADANCAGLGTWGEGRSSVGHRSSAGPDLGVGGMDHPNDARLEGLGGRHQTTSGRVTSLGSAAAPSEPCGVADDPSNGRSEQRANALRSNERGSAQELEQRLGRSGVLDLGGQTGPTNGFWRAADWLGCRDGKWRPVEPGTFPLAHGATARVGRLRAYGNAINAEAAAAFLVAARETLTPA